MYRSTVDRVIPTIRQKQTDGSPGEYRSFRRSAAGKSIEIVCRSCALAERRGKNNNEDKLTGRTAVGFSERKNKQKDLRRGGGSWGWRERSYLPIPTRSGPSRTSFYILRFAPPRPPRPRVRVARSFCFPLCMYTYGFFPSPATLDPADGNR